MDSIRLRSHAKVNLSLRVMGKRSDGYHEISSFMQGVGIHDVIEIKKCFKNETKYNLPHCNINGILVYLCADIKTIPQDMSNLALRGIDAVTKAVSEDPEARGNMPETLLVSIEKKLPVAAGLAGGSGNAAACMLGLNMMLGCPYTLRELMDKGAAVGADVPFSIFMNAFRNAAVLSGMPGLEEARDSAMTAGIGDIVNAAEPVPRYVVLANPGTVVSTQKAYRALDELGIRTETEDAGELFVNDFEKYTLQSDSAAAELHRLLTEESGADEVLMSGSGPTMAAYYIDEDRARSGYERLSRITGADERIRIWFSDTGIVQGDA